MLPLVTSAIVSALWRYPVKSLRGERLDAADLDARGVAGDRAYAVLTPDGKPGSGKNTRRFGRIDGLLALAAHLGDDGVPVITLPDGATIHADDPTAVMALRRALDQRVSLARERDVSHFDAAPIHLVTSSSLAWLRAAVSNTAPNTAPNTAIDERRLRPNIVLDTGDAPPHIEEQWIGRTLAIGPVRLRIHKRTERCVMVGHAQSDLAASPDVLRAIANGNGACIGVYANVIEAGRIHTGATVEIR
jgi:hypothetical protein